MAAIVGLFHGRRFEGWLGIMNCSLSKITGTIFKDVDEAVTKSNKLIREKLEYITNNDEIYERTVLFGFSAIKTGLFQSKKDFLGRELSFKVFNLDIDYDLINSYNGVEYESFFKNTLQKLLLKTKKDKPVLVLKYPVHNMNIIDLIPFKVHITGDEKLMEEFIELGIKVIKIDLLKPDSSVLRTEYMSSQIVRCREDQIFIFIDALKQKIKNGKIIREKIECPPIDKLLNKALYIETHFSSDDFKYPVIQNLQSKRFISTKREYKKNNFKKFIDENKYKNIECCIHDTFIEEDKDWFSLYP
jgi:hypothetical protein